MNLFRGHKVGEPIQASDELLKDMAEMVSAIEKMAGAPHTAHHPRYGIVLREGKLTEAGSRMLEDAGILRPNE